MLVKIAGRQPPTGPRYNYQNMAYSSALLRFTKPLNVINISRNMQKPTFLYSFKKYMFLNFLTFIL